MNTAEYLVLKRYIKGEDIGDKNDVPVLERYASIGLVKRIGYSIERGTLTAVLTDIGRRWVNREKVRRNPILKFLHNYYVYITR